MVYIGEKLTTFRGIRENEVLLFKSLGTTVEQLVQSIKNCRRNWLRLGNYLQKKIYMSSGKNLLMFTLKDKYNTSIALPEKDCSDSTKCV